jgi:diguanylate cyclase (GGDEF)-like protein
MDFHEWASAIGWFIVVTSGSFVLLCLITSYTRFERMTRQLEADHRAMDPHDAFQLAVSQALGTAHRLPQPFCVFVLGVSGTAEHTGAVMDVLRKTLRADDELFALKDNRFGLLVYSNRTHAGGIYQRLRLAWQAVAGAGTSFLAAGISSCPENGERVAELISAAEAALEQAASSDGEAGFVLAPPAAAAEMQPPTETEPPAPSRYADPLTGLLRPEYLEKAVQKHVAARRRKNRPVSLLLIDVDHLERYNSHYGRDAGDAILKTIGGLIEKGFRETDLTARLSGEEFLVTAGCRPAEALLAGQRLVSAVKRTPIAFGREHLRVTVKIGVAGFPDHGGHPRFLLEKADAALGVARERGGNTCVLYDRSMQAAVQRPRGDRF